MVRDFVFRKWVSNTCYGVISFTVDGFIMLKFLIYLFVQKGQIDKLKIVTLIYMNAIDNMINYI
jgi:hypothetical protein